MYDGTWVLGHVGPLVQSVRVCFSDTCEVFLLDSEMLEHWYWAPISREVGDTWRWWSGSPVDLSRNDMDMLRTQPTSSQPSCAVWRLNDTLMPASCERRHRFMCLRNTCECIGFDPLSDLSVQSDQSLRELSGADQSNRVSYMFLPSRTNESDSGSGLCGMNGTDGSLDE